MQMFSFGVAKPRYDGVGQVSPDGGQLPPLLVKVEPLDGVVEKVKVDVGVLGLDERPDPPHQAGQGREPVDHYLEPFHFALVGFGSSQVLPDPLQLELFGRVVLVVVQGPAHTNKLACIANNNR